MTSRQADYARARGVITRAEAAARYSVSPAYVAWQLDVTTGQLGRDHLDLVYLHNPERAGTTSDEVKAAITAAFAVLEQAADSDRIGGYGVATWTGLSSGTFTVTDLVRAACTAATGPATHLTAVQTPASLITIAPISQAASGRGPIAEAAAAGLTVWASAPLHGGILPGLLTPAIADVIRPGLDPAEAALLVVASTPGLYGFLISTADPAHWRQAQAAARATPVSSGRLRGICAVLDP